MLIEPFAGGAIVSLTAIMEDLAEQAVLIELDRDVAAFWRAALLHGPSLVARIASFTPTRELVRDLERRNPESVVEQGFRTLVLNRTHRAGILAPGSSLNRRGENGKGILSRWYPKTLIARLNAISEYADRIAFHEADSMQLIEPLLQECGRDAAVFVDPPYTAGGKRAGTRLYTHNDLDHERLFWIMAQHEASVLMTYDYSPEVVRLVNRYGFQAVQVGMKNAHHDHLAELVITREQLFA
jgi:DNA adenine methylase